MEYHRMRLLISSLLLFMIIIMITTNVMAHTNNNMNSNTIITTPTTSLSSTSGADDIIYQFAWLQNCRNPSTDMIYVNQTHTFTNARYPLDFYCNYTIVAQRYDVSIPVTYSRWNRFLLVQRPDLYDTCGAVETMENILNITCVELLCDSGLEDLSQITSYGGLQLHDWINSCQYCRRHAKEFRTRTLLQQCNPRDTLASQMINQFPSTITYCGRNIIGFPLVINNSMLSSYYSSEPFSYYCACQYMFFAFNCDGDSRLEELIFLINTTIIVFETIMMAGFVLFVFLPKVKQCVRTKRYLNLCTGLYCLAYLVTFNISYWVANFLPEDHRSVFYTLNVASPSFLIMALFSWVHYWIRIVWTIQKVRNITIKSIIFQTILFLIAISFAFIIPIVVFYTVYRIFQNAYFIIMAVLSLLSTLAFIISSIWANISLKKLTDIEITQNAFYSKFVVFVSTLLLLMASFFIATVASDNINEIWKILLGVLIIIFEFAIVIALFYSEYDNDEFKSFYYFKKISSDSELNATLSESLVNHNSGYSSMKDESLDTTTKEYYTSQSSVNSK